MLLFSSVSSIVLSRLNFRELSAPRSRSHLFCERLVAAAQVHLQPFRQECSPAVVALHQRLRVVLVERLVAELLELLAAHRCGVDDVGRGHVRGEVVGLGVPVPIEVGEVDGDGFGHGWALFQGDFDLEKFFVFFSRKNVLTAQLIPRNSHKLNIIVTPGEVNTMCVHEQVHSTYYTCTDSSFETCVHSSFFQL